MSDPIDKINQQHIQQQQQQKSPPPFEEDKTKKVDLSNLSTFEKGLVKRWQFSPKDAKIFNKNVNIL